MLVVGILPTRVRDLDSTLVSRLGGIFLHLILQVSSSADALQWSYKRVRPSSPKSILGIGCKSSLPLVGVRVCHRPRPSWAYVVSLACPL